MKIMIVMACTAALLSTVHAAPFEKATLSIDKDRIKVWTYPHRQNAVLRYQAETIYDCSLEKAVALILDIEHATKWVPYMGRAQVLSSDAQKGESLMYMVLDFPFPLKDRDVLVHSKISKDTSGVTRIKNKAVNQGYAQNTDYIRLTNYVGDWTFQALGPHQVKVTTSGYANPEGAIPVSFVNMFVQQQPYQMLQKMKIELAKPSRPVLLPEAVR